MRSARRPYPLLHLLALLAVSLMLAAPLVSRWQQALPASAAQPMCSERAPDAWARFDPTAAASPGHAAGSHAVASRFPTGPDPSLQDPAGHAGAACDYCVLAARLLPGLAVLFVLLAALCPVPPPAGPVRAGRAAPRWPAHAARGPPLAA